MIASAVFVAGALITLIAAYLVSLRVHPWTRCRRCSGGGKSKDRIWRGAHGTCPSCGGRGRHPRLGVRIFTPGRARQMTAPKASHRSIDKRGPR